ncbi:SCP2 sterol-binding domain-containing protein [Burkholderia sp. TSV86]|uniref:SCP2 sterol-binding domain-containing protein n=1 Tax=Burkholderia sp. TSV86 TaxID=1385594 RepID=UPI00075B5760|nr:SCP2 sterol-binding domain-containing protein [Burkholderia sp. TSV86]KVE37365.1 hypothetical protein WS68_02790 [Burkholderia sp. TSV86]
MNAVDALQQLPTLYRGGDHVNKTIQFDISQPTYLRIRDGQCSAVEGRADDADLTLRLSDDDLVDLLNGKLDGTMAVMSGKLKLSGDVMLAQQIETLFDTKSLL